MKFKRLPARYGALIMPFVLSLFMTAVVSFIATVNAVGLTQAAIGLWPSTWMASWSIAFPTLLVVQPAVRRIVAAMVEPAAAHAEG